MRFAIVGTNFVSDTFMESAALIEECSVVAVCGKSYSNTLKFKEKYGIPNAFESVSELILWGEFDAAYIATPNSTHKEIAEAFINAGKHVLIEKPMCSNLSEVERLTALAKDGRVYLQEGLMPLFSENFKIIKDSLKRVGRVRQVNINMSQYSRRYEAYLNGENPTTFRRELSNGATMDLGVYTFAACIALFGAPKKVLSAASLLENGVDVSASAILLYDGFVANLAYSKASDSENRFEISGEEGILSINHPAKIESIIFKSRNADKREELAVRQKPLFYYEIKEMIDLVKRSAPEPLSVPHRLSREIHRTLTEARTCAGISFPADNL